MIKTKCLVFSYSNSFVGIGIEACNHNDQGTLSQDFSTVRICQPLIPSRSTFRFRIHREIRIRKNLGLQLFACGTDRTLALHDYAGDFRGTVTIRSIVGTFTANMFLILKNNCFQVFHCLFASVTLPYYDLI